MKKVILSLAVIASILVSCKGEKKDKVEVKEEVMVVDTAATNNVDVSTSVITWKGEKPTGTHNGVIMLKEGAIIMDGEMLTGGEFVIDMASIQNKDLDAESAAKLVGHLTSADFFDIATYPTSKFVITSVEETEGELAVTGNLTLKNVTKSITIPATVYTTEGVTTFESAKFFIDRADFNVKYGSKKFFDDLKDKFINDLMELSFVVNTTAATM
jgi:polyisoprenoid-binding protein YceI